MSHDELEDMAYLPGSGSGPDYAYPPEAYPAQPGFVTAFWNPYEVKHRRRTSRAQLAVLEREFDNDPKPNADKRRALAAQLNMTPRAIQVWFQNRRAKIKAIKNKIPGGRGMPKLKPGEKAASRAVRSATKPVSESDDEDEEKPDADSNGTGQWIQLAATPSTSVSPTTASPLGASFPQGPSSSSPSSNDRTPPASTSSKPQFTIAVPPPDHSTSGPNSAVRSGPSSPDFLAPPPPPPSDQFLAPPSPQAMLRRGSAPAPLQGIHRARYSNFTANVNNNGLRPNEVEMGIPPVSPISPPDHEVAPLRRAPLSLARRPSLPDSHLRLPAHPYYNHSYDRSREGSGPRMQRRGGLLSPVPDVGHEQEQGHVPYHNLSIPTMLPPAPSLHPSGQNQSQDQSPSRIYRLPPGMGANPAAHDLPTQLPARPDTFNNNSNSGWRMHAPARPFAVPVAGPLPAADFSFGAPEPGHGDAFNRAMQNEGDFGQSNQSNHDFNPSNDFSSSNPDFHSSNPDFHTADFSSSPTEFDPSSATSEFAPPGSTLWDARTRFGSMASIASDVTGVSVSSTQATSVSGGLGTAGFGECTPGGEGAFDSFGDARNGLNGGFRNGFGYGHGYPSGFQPDMRRASCPGEFLHQFSGMGMNGGSPNERSVRPSPLGRSLTIAPDAPPLPHNQGQGMNHRGLTLNPETHRSASGVNLALEAKSLRSPTFPPGQVDPTYPPPPPGPSVSDRGPFAPRDQQQQGSLDPSGAGQYQQSNGNGQYQQPNMTPAQRALVGGGFGSDHGFQQQGGYEAEMRTPPGFDGASPVDGGMHSAGMEGMHSAGMERIHSGSGKGSPMLFAGVGVEGDPSFDLNTMNPDSLAMAMIGHEYSMPSASEFAFP
ncbi:hypothetical protein FRC07_008825 [Ceratobasidium sp. 392]|nr:hypothetical protein FRC07_008825 [Ceratobasidium sp. 392]